MAPARDSLFPTRHSQLLQDEGGSFLTHSAIASTTAAGCSGSSAWLAFGITATVTRSGNSSFNSFSVPFGLNGSTAACKSSSGTLPAAHQSDCLTFAAATRWPSLASVHQPFSQIFGSLPV